VFRYLVGEEELECKEAIDGTTMGLYRIEVGDDWEIKILYKDNTLDEGDLKELCTVTIDPIDNLVGRVTFSGYGFIDSIVIIEP
jgi:hypothetical protein